MAEQQQEPIMPGVRVNVDVNGKHIAQQAAAAIMGDLKLIGGTDYNIAKGPPTDRARHETIQAAVWTILVALDIDPQTQHSRETPRRVADALLEFCQPCDLIAVLKDGFENGVHESHGTAAMVTQSKIPFRLLCPHHLMPAYGTAAIGYIPHRKIVGLSKLARLTQAAGTRRPATQEDVTNEIADTLVKGLDPTGVMVVTSAMHSCMSCRGANVPGVVTTVSAIRGAFLTVGEARTEFLSLIKD